MRGFVDSLLYFNVFLRSSAIASFGKAKSQIQYVGDSGDAEMC